MNFCKILNRIYLHFILESGNKQHFFFYGAFRQWLSKDSLQ